MGILARLSALLVVSAGLAHAAERSAEEKALVGHWTMDDQAAAREVRDSSASAFHGSLTADTAASSRPPER